MKIGIDVSQAAYSGTGVGNYVLELVKHLVSLDATNEYVLFFSSMRRKFPISNFQFPISNKRVAIKTFMFPPTLLDIFWNRLHIAPIEWFIGDVDIFLSSDWTQPPSKAKKATILYDLIVYKYPGEMDEKIVNTQKARLAWVKKEVDIIICISEATRQDAIKILGIDEKRLHVVYPGV